MNKQGTVCLGSNFAITLMSHFLTFRCLTEGYSKDKAGQRVGQAQPLSSLKRRTRGTSAECRSAGRKTPRTFNRLQRREVRVQDDPSGWLTLRGLGRWAASRRWSSTGRWRTEASSWEGSPPRPTDLLNISMWWSRMFWWSVLYLPISAAYLIKALGP